MLASRISHLGNLENVPYILPSICISDADSDSHERMSCSHEMAWIASYTTACSHEIASGVASCIHTKHAKQMYNCSHHVFFLVLKVLHRLLHPEVIPINVDCEWFEIVVMSHPHITSGQPRSDIKLLFHIQTQECRVVWDLRQRVHGSGIGERQTSANLEALHIHKIHFQLV